MLRRFIAKAILNATANIIIVMAIAFALLGMPKPDRKSCTMMPITGRLRIQRSKRGLDLAKQEAARIIKTVVGRPGTAIPINPTAVKIIPKKRKKYFVGPVLTELCDCFPTLSFLSPIKR
tara:strand:+ start:1087 stop:1446 length:360 start_codon:yes stop_codon:yes gene_type:complete